MCLSLCVLLYFIINRSFSWPQTCLVCQRLPAYPSACLYLPSAGNLKVQASLAHAAILLSRPPECWGYGYLTTHNSTFLFYFYTGSHSITPPVLELTVWTRLDSNSQSPTCLCRWRAWPPRSRLSLLFSPPLPGRLPWNVDGVEGEPPPSPDSC